MSQSVHSKPALGRNLLIAGSALILAIVVAVIALTPSPQQHRNFHRDQRVIGHLHALQAAIEQWHQQHGQLPKELATLNTQPGVQLALQPADGGPAYRYQPGDGRHYQLCAHFLTDTAHPDTGRLSWTVPGAERTRLTYDLEWAHGRGEQCYQRQVPVRADTPPATTSLD